VFITLVYNFAPSCYPLDAINLNTYYPILCTYSNSVFLRREGRRETLRVQRSYSILKRHYMEKQNKKYINEVEMTG
jgi:hypothetical protein